MRVMRVQEGDRVITLARAPHEDPAEDEDPPEDEAEDETEAPEGETE